MKLDSTGKKMLKRHNIMGVGERDEAPLYKTKNKKQTNFESS